MLGLALKMTARDWRAGELHLLLAALAVSAAAMTAVGFFTDRIRGAMQRDAAQSLGADLLVSSDAPLDPAWRADAEARGLRVSATVSMISMATVAGARDPAAVAGLAGDTEAAGGGGVADGISEPVAGAEAPPRLVALKAVAPGYPLRGALGFAPAIGPACAAGASCRSEVFAAGERLVPAPTVPAHRRGVPSSGGTAPDQATGTSTAAGTGTSKAAGTVAADPGIPASGTAWIDTALAGQLALRPGAMLRVGDARFTVTRLIAVEPDRRFSPVNVAPRVMIAAVDLAATGLVAPGARATYALLLAGDAAAVDGFRIHLQAMLDAAGAANVRIQTAGDSNAALAQTLDRAGAFLSLSGLLSAMLAAVAIAMAARRYMLCHLDACAMLRCLGLRQARVLQLYLTEFLLLALAGSALGTLAGYGIHLLLLQWLEQLLPAALPAAGWRPALQGMAAGPMLLAGFALPSLLQLHNVPHTVLLRRERQAPRGMALLAGAAGVSMFGLLLLWITGDAVLAAASGAGLLLAALLYGAAAWLALMGLGGLRGMAAGPAWRFAVTALRRQPASTIAQTVSLAIGLTLLLLTVVRNDLLAAWRAALPADAPNHLVLNVQPDQEEAMRERLARYGHPALHPSIRARLLTVNGKPAGTAGKGDGGKGANERKASLALTDVDLSSADTLPATSPLSAGRWFDPASRAPEVSLDHTVARDFGIGLGDVLAFDVGGLPLQARVTSLRKVDWRARTPNFEFMLNAAAAQGLPRTYTAFVHVPSSDRRAAGALARGFPNVTVIDFGFLLGQLHGVLAQVAVAVEFLFLLTLASGLLVLYAALAGSQELRRRQAAILRTLGATRSQLARAQWMEHALAGALAGLLAAAGATLAGWALARFMFDLAWHWSAPVWAAGLGAGMACSVAGGWLGLRTVLNQAPLATLRQSA